MKTNLSSVAVTVAGFILLHSAICLRAQGQTYSMDWYKIAGGGGASTGGLYSVSGTIGQPDASGAMSGGSYSMTGGFWSLISVLQTPGAPTLFIRQAGNSVTVYWQNVPGWNLVQSPSVASLAANWSAAGTAALVNGTNYLTTASPGGNLFFRLKE
jgi:hypothetical protein